MIQKWSGCATAWPPMHLLMQRKNCKTPSLVNELKINCQFVLSFPLLRCQLLAGTQQRYILFQFFFFVCVCGIFSSFFSYVVIVLDIAVGLACVEYRNQFPAYSKEQPWMNMGFMRPSIVILKRFYRSTGFCNLWMNKRHYFAWRNSIRSRLINIKCILSLNEFGVLGSCVSLLCAGLLRESFGTYGWL